MMRKSRASGNPDIDMQHRYAPTSLMTVHGMQPVKEFVVHSPGHHPHSPLINTVTALECKTPYGSRWFGVERAYINSQLRMVVVGTNRRDEVRMKWTVVPKKYRDAIQEA